MKRVLSWTIGNGLMAWLSYSAIIGLSAGAGHLLIFILWFVLACMFICAFVPSAARELRSHGRPVPGFLSHFVGVLFIVFYAYNGWIAAAVLQTIAEMLEASIFQSDDADDE